jgi:hypothetical protein
MVEPLHENGLRLEKVAGFQRWLQCPSCRAQLDRHTDREVLRALMGAPTLSRQLAGLLAYFWLRIGVDERAAVATALAVPYKPDWGAIHGLLAVARRHVKETFTPHIRRGHGAWTPEQLKGLTCPQREVATLRGWYGLLVGAATDTVTEQKVGAPTLHLNLASAPNLVGTWALAVFLARCPGVGQYLTAKVLYGLDLLGLAQFDFGVVGPGAVQAAVLLHGRTGGDAFTTTGIWPWEHDQGAGQVRALLTHLAHTLNMPWLFIQVALCMWKMGGAVVPAPIMPSPDLARTTRRRLRGKRKLLPADTIQQLCRTVMRTAHRIMHDANQLADQLCADFMSDSAWFVMTYYAVAGHVGIDAQQQSLRRAAALHFPANHPVASAVAVWCEGMVAMRNGGQLG